MRLCLYIFDVGRKCSECGCCGSVRRQPFVQLSGRRIVHTMWFSNEIQFGTMIDARVRPVAVKSLVSLLHWDYLFNSSILLPARKAIKAPLKTIDLVKRPV